ncbi:MAG: MFS transporter [Alphaproteobacteria bacterium]|nr:MFS transporter [Alphaproteobacteria bacterium]
MNPYLAVLAIVLAAVALQIANGLFGTFLPLRMAADGFSAAAIGTVVTGHSIGFFVGCLTVSRLIRTIGHIRAFAVFAAAASITVLSFAMATDVIYWTALRVLLGFCSAGLFTITESWLSERTEPAARGRVIGFYMVFNRLSFATGQLLVAAGDIMGLGLFMITAAAYTTAMIPIATTRASSPPIPGVVTMNPLALIAIAPAGVVGCFVSGLTNTTIIGLMPVYGTGLALSAGAISILLALMQVGSLVSQWPLGLISDRMDRRRVIVFISLGNALVSAIIVAVGVAPVWVLVPLSLLWGAFALSLYAICLAHASDHAPPDRIVALVSNLLLVWGAGSVVGPPIATAMISILGPGGLFVYSAAVALVLAAFVAWRMTRRAPVPADLRERFVTVPETTPTVAELDPRRADERGAGTR